MVDTIRVFGKINEKGQKALADMTPEERIAALIPYDLKKSHKRIVVGDSKEVPGGGHLIVQDGQVYKYGSGEHMGPVAMLVPPPNTIMCKRSGATFPNTPVGKYKLQQWQEEHGYIDEAAAPGEELSDKKGKAKK